MLITHIVSACLQQQGNKTLDPADVWTWSLHQRLQALLLIALASLPTTLFLSYQCSRDDCREKMELPLDLNLFRMDETKNSLQCKPEETIEVELRLPTGKDQQYWLTHTNENLEKEMAKFLVTHINGKEPAPDWQIPNAWLEPIAQTLEEHDPFTVMSLQTACPACGRVSDVDFDLENYLLRQLEIQQWRLKQQVHELASVYHWSENDIVSLPKSRREEYLHFIHEAMHT